MGLAYYLVTRINLFLYTGENLYPRNRKNHKKWSDDRMDLIRNFHLPTLLNQTSKSYTLLWLVDEGTPKYRMDELKKLQSGMDVPHDIITCNSDKHREALKAWLQDNAKYPHLTTTRVDTDDLLHKDFLRTIQRKAIALSTTPKRCIIDLPHGLRLHRDGRIGKDENFKMNNFISMYERVEPKDIKKDALTVWHDQHTVMEKYGKRHPVVTPNPMWIMYCHGFNLANTFKGEEIEDISFLGDDFGVNYKTFMEWRKACQSTQ